MDIETKLKVQDWQRKVREGTWTLDDARDATDYLRAGRQKSVEVSEIKATRAKAKAAPKKKSNLLAQFEQQMKEAKDAGAK